MKLTKIYIRLHQQVQGKSVFQIGDRGFTDDEIREWKFHKPREILKLDKSLKYIDLGKKFFIIYETVDG